MMPIAAWWGSAFPRNPGSGFRRNRQLARSRLRESASLWRALGDLPQLATVLNRLAQALPPQDDEEALALFEESLALWQHPSVGRDGVDRLGRAAPLVGLGNIALRRGDPSAARAYYQRALTLRRDGGGAWAIAHVVSSLADVARAEGDYGQAAVLLKEALELWWQVGDRGYAAATVRELAALANSCGRPLDSARLLRTAAVLEAAHDEAVPCGASADGRASLPEQAVRDALAVADGLAAADPPRR
jgi:tetratricopeptide (TPR) repeat protein